MAEPPFPDSPDRAPPPYPRSPSSATVAEASATPGRPASFAGLFSWALFDWANSSYSAVIQTFVFAAYFTRSIAPDETVGTAWWGNAVGLSGLLIALLAPLLGAYTDQRGRRKPLLGALTGLCIVSTALLWFVAPSPEFLWPAVALIVVGAVAFELAAVLYNGMLPELAPAQGIGKWSGWGWALGYAGGLCSLILALVLFINGQGARWGLDAARAEHVRAAFILTALWFLVFALPLFFFTPDRPATSLPRRQALFQGWRQILHTARSIGRFRHLVRFFIAHMLYIDGLATIFVFGGIYAAGTFGMDEQEVLLFGIGLNVTGGLGAALAAPLDDRMGGKHAVLIALAGLLLTGTLILLVENVTAFWLVGLTLGLFVGPAQAAGRSYLARMAPAELRNEMFGFLAFSGKATAFAAPLMVGWLTLASGSQRVGMTAILLFLLGGLLLMLGVPSDRPGTRSAAVRKGE